MPCSGLVLAKDDDDDSFCKTIPAIGVFPSAVVMPISNRILNSSSKPGAKGHLAVFNIRLYGVLDTDCYEHVS